MPSKLDETYDPRPWRCDECRRVLGVVMRDLDRIRRLWVFTLDRADADVPPTLVLRNPPKGLFKIHGAEVVAAPGGVECSRCGSLTRWVSKDEAFERLMSHYPKKLV
jgi:hypothetical protein